MTPAEEELGEYVPSSTPIRRPSSTNKPSSRKWLAAAVAAAAIVWIGIAAVTETTPPHSPRGTAKRAPSAVRQEAAVSALPVGAAEYLSADLPALSSYTPRYGARYNPVPGYFGPVDATVTHGRLGDYSIEFPNLADPHTSIEIRAYDRSSICYSLESRGLGVDERIRVRCVRLVRAFPALTTPTDSRFTVSVMQPPRH